MANITKYLQKIKDARYGKDVKASFIDSLIAINAESEQAVSEASASVQSALEAQKSAEKSKEIASTAKDSASNSATNAATSENNAKSYASNAKTSENNAKTYASNAKVSETNSKTSETNAANSATLAATSATNASASEANAKTYANNAKTFATNAKASEANLKTAETNAANSATTSKSWAVGGTGTRAGEDTDNSKIYASNAKASASSASTSASNATSSENNAKSYASNANASENNAKTYASNAKASETNAANSASSAEISATNASNSASSAKTAQLAAEKAKEGAEAAKNNISSVEAQCKAYADQCNNATASLKGGLIPKGTVEFSGLPSLGTAEVGWMYNVSDDFTSTTDFVEGEGFYYPAGTNLYVISINSVKKWDCLAGSTVTGVKGNAESTYSQGNVNITPAKIGLGNVPNVKTNDQTVTYSDISTLSTLTSGEKISVSFAKIKKAISDLISHITDTIKHITNDERTKWNNVTNKLDTTGNASNVTNTFSAASSRSNLTTGEKLSVSLGKIMKYFADLKAVAFSGSYNDLSNKPTIPTVTNNLLTTNPGTALDAAQGKAISDKIGSTDISGIGDGTVTGAVSELNSNLRNVKIFPFSVTIDKLTAGKENVGVSVNIPDLQTFLGSATWINSYMMPLSNDVYGDGYAIACKSIINGTTVNLMLKPIADWSNTTTFKGVIFYI